MKKLRILIADDHPIFRSGVKEILCKEDWIEVIAEAENGIIAYQKIIAYLPDIAILDLEMPMLNGLDVCKKVLSEKHSTSFIILTMHKEKQFYDEAIKAGVMGYLLKDNASTELIYCIKEVAKGNFFVEHQLQNLQNNNFLSDDMQKVNALLTPTEKIIISLISKGKTSIEIADLLFISPNTVDNHRSNMAKKLMLEGKNSLLKFAMNIHSEL